MREENTQAKAPSDSAYVPPDEAELQRRELEGLRERLFGALQADEFLAEALREVDHAYDISRGMCSKLLDVAAANYEDAKKWRAAQQAAPHCVDGACSECSPKHDLSDAYQGAREDVAIWKRRALEAEEINRRFVADINGQTFMGEPAPGSVKVRVGIKVDPKTGACLRADAPAQTPGKQP